MVVRGRRLALMVFYKIRETGQSGWRLKSRLKGRAMLRTLRHEVRLRGLQNVRQQSIRWGAVCETCVGRFCGRRPFRRGFNRPRPS
jgi:hypothetical protein